MPPGEVLAVARLNVLGEEGEPPARIGWLPKMAGHEGIFAVRAGWSGGKECTDETVKEMMGDGVLCPVAAGVKQAGGVPMPWTSA